MSADADIYGEQGDDCYLILANEKARCIINKGCEPSLVQCWGPALSWLGPM